MSPAKVRYQSQIKGRMKALQGTSCCELPELNPKNPQIDPKSEYIQERQSYKVLKELGH